MRPRNHLIDHTNALRLQHHRVFLISRRPQDDRGRVAVALDHHFELRHALGIGTHLPRLAHHHHAHTIASLDPLWCGHVVRSANRIAAHVLQYGQAVPLQAVRQSCAYAGMILMVAGAFDFHVLAIEKKSFVGIPC